MVKHTIRWEQLTNCLIVFDHFVGLVLKRSIDSLQANVSFYFNTFWSYSVRPFAVIATLSCLYKPGSVLMLISLIHTAIRRIASVGIIRNYYDFF